MKNKGKLIKFSIAVIIMMMVSGVRLTISAQEMGKDKGMMSDEDTLKMMQEPNKVLANGSIQYLAIFTNLLYIQAGQRRGQISKDFIKGSFGEIKRAYEMAEQFQKAHVKTMDAAMQEKVKMMMMRMNRNLAGIKAQIDLLEKEVNSGNNLDVIIARTGEIRAHLEDLFKMRSDMDPKQEMPGQKGMMMK
jgi:hypothetical protein